MDSAYDSYKTIASYRGDWTASQHHHKSPGGIDAITRGSLHLSEDCSYTCVAGFKVVYWRKDKMHRRLKFRCLPAVGRCQCFLRATCSLSPYGKTFYLRPNRDYRLIGPVPRGTDPWQEKYNARTSVERTYSEEEGSHRLANPRGRRASQSEDPHLSRSLCSGDKENRSYDNGEAFHASPYSMPCKGLESLKKRW